MVPASVRAQLGEVLVKSLLSKLSDADLDLVRLNPSSCRPVRLCSFVPTETVKSIAETLIAERARNLAFVTWASTATIGAVSVLTAIFVALIGFFQWRTAREKLVLDLFKDRLAVYSKVREAIRKIMGPGYAKDNEVFVLLHEARDEAQFLFGDDVELYLRELLRHAANTNLARDMMEAQRTGAAAPDGQDYPKLWHDSMMAIDAATRDFPKLLSRYMRMAQAMPKIR